jgi:BMFP domain-containing protein YqiC
MQINNILKVLAGASTIAQSSAKTVLEKGHTLVEDHILQGKYVSREEFENVKDLVLQLQKQLSDLNR